MPESDAMDNDQIGQTQTVTVAQRPIVFVHGMNGYSGIFDDLKKAFRAAGYTDSDFSNYNHNSDKELVQMARDFRDWVRRTFGSRQIDIVAHSMGSLFTRYAIKGNPDTTSSHLGNPLGGQVVAWVSIAGPNHGVKGAGFCPGFVAPACADMGANGSFISNLNKGIEAPPPTRYLTYRTPCDELVGEWSVPLEGGDNRVTTSVCSRGGAANHDAIARAEDVINGIVEFVRPGRGMWKVRVDAVTMLKGDEQGNTGDDLYGDITVNGTYVWSVSRDNQLVDKKFPYDLPGIDHKWVESKEGRATIYIHVVDADTIGDDELVDDAIYLSPNSESGTHTVTVTGKYGEAVLTYTVSGGPRPSLGGTYTLMASHSRKMADVKGGNFSNGNPIVQYAANFSPAQKWKLLAGYAAGIYQLQAGGLCLREVGGAVTLGSCTGGYNYWQLKDAGDGFTEIQNDYSGTYLDVPHSSTANNVELITWGRTGNANQKWLMSRVDQPQRRLLDTDYTLEIDAREEQTDTNYFKLAFTLHNGTDLPISDWVLSFLVLDEIQVEGTDPEALMKQLTGPDRTHRVEVFGRVGQVIEPQGHIAFALHGSGNHGTVPDITSVLLNGEDVQTVWTHQTPLSEGEQP